MYILVYLGKFSSCCVPLALALPQSLFWDETDNQVMLHFIVSVSCLFYLVKVNLVVVEEVHDDLHDAREDHQAGAGDEKDVDIVK